MKNLAMKATALTLGAALLLGSASTAVYALHNDRNIPVVNEPKLTSTSTAKQETAAKDETVYVFSGADGSVQKVLVSEWLKNPEKAETLADVSNLTDIENVKGDETFTAGSDGKLTWNANGADIYYQGTSKQELPVDISIHYALDGKEIKPEDLAGKSGKITIRFEYKNNQFETVTIDGKEEKIYVPFTMLTGMMLDTDIFRNVSVTNGKLENLGNEIVVVGIAFPGMQENLNIAQEDLEIPSFVEITADVENFEMGPTMTLASAALLQNLPTDDLDLSELTDSMGKLSDGMTQLMDGSGKLYEGLNTLLEQSKLLVNGIDQLCGGAAKLQNGANALNSGAAQLQAGAEKLSGGLNTLNANSATLNNGAAQVFNTLLATANKQLQEAGLEVPQLTIGNYAEVLNKIIASLDENAVYEQALQQVTAAVNEKRGEIETAVTAGVREKITPVVTEKVTEFVRGEVSKEVQKKENVFRTAVVAKLFKGMTLEEYNKAVEAGQITKEQQAAVNAAVEGAMQQEIEKQMKSPAIQAKITAASKQKLEEQMASDEIKALIAKTTEETIQQKISETMASPEIQAKLQAAAEGAKAVIALKASLDSYNSFYLGLKTYTNGVASASAGANELIAGTNALKSGMGELTTGVGQLSEGINTMKGKSPALIDGITQLRDGSKALQDGLTKFMEEGIQKILDLADHDLPALTDRVSATVDAAKHYTTFTGTADMDCTVKFLYKTDSIEVKN